MNSLRKTVGFLMVLMLAGFALPAAAQKTFISTLNPTTIATAPALTLVTVTVENNSPANSNINSIAIVPPSGFAITVDALHPCTPSGPAVKNNTKCLLVGGQLQVTSFNGLTSNTTGSGPHIMTLKFYMNTTTTCQVQWGPDNVQAFTGNTPGTGGTPFTLVSPSVPINADVCAIAITKQPADALAGAIITTTDYNVPATADRVTVALTVNGNPSPVTDGKQVTLTSSACAISNGTASVPTVPSGTGLATFSQLKSAVGNACTLVASAPGFGTSAPSAPFNITAPDGTLVCAGQTGTSTFTDSTNTVTGNRGAFNKDGSTCIPVVYGATGLATQGDKVVNFKWDTASQPNGAFSYLVTWNPTAVNSITGMPNRRTKVAWQAGLYGHDTITGDPDWVYGVACLSPDLPAPYGTLGSWDAANSRITITVPSPLTAGFATLPTTADPFPLVIGTERMLATLYSGTTYTVTRSNGTNGTTPVILANFIGANVMSTPLPIDNNPLMAPPNDGSVYPATINPYLNKQANMCIQFEGFMSVSPGFVRFKTNIFDIGDGWASQE